MQQDVERRRGRRVRVEVPLRIRRASGAASEAFRDQTSKDISLAGVYFETDEPDAFAPQDLVVTAVSIPEGQRREFPFTRLSGRGRVVRVQDVSGAGSGGRRRVGVAVEFADDLTALTAIPTRG